MTALLKTNSVVATDSCQDLTLLSDNDDSSESEQNSDTSNEKMDIDEDNGFLPRNDEDEHIDSDNFDKISDKMQQPGEPDTSMLKSYKDYVQYSLNNNLSLNKKELAAIQLVSTLRATAATLETYDRIMEWHFHVTGNLQDPYKLSDVSGYVSRKSSLVSHYFGGDQQRS